MTSDPMATERLLRYILVFGKLLLEPLYPSLTLTDQRSTAMFEHNDTCSTS